MKFILFIFMFFLSACESLPAVVRQWDCKQKQDKLTSFVLECSKSNDDLDECYQIALKTVCTASDVKIRIFD